MSISGISGGGSSHAVDPQELFKKWADQKLKTRGDRVSISEEGYEKAEELAKAKRAAKAGPLGMDDAGEEAEGIAASADAEASSALNNSAAEQSEGLEAKIKALQDQLMSIMQSALSPEEKTQQAQPIQQMISQLQMQMNELKAQAQKAA